MQTQELARVLLGTAGQITDLMLTELKERDPEMLVSVATAIKNGEFFSLSVVCDPENPRILLEAVNDYGSRRLIASIASVPSSVGKH